MSDGPMNDEQRARWDKTGVFPIERWNGTPPVCPMPTVEELRSLSAAVPDHIRLSGWYVGKPAFGHRYVYADNFRGMGRQWVCDFPAGKDYFGSLAEYVAAVHPRTVIRLLDRIAELEAATPQPSVKALTGEVRLAVLDAAAICDTVCHYEVSKKLRALLAAEQPSEPASNCDPADVCVGCCCKYGARYRAPDQVEQPSEDKRDAWVAVSVRVPDDGALVWTTGINEHNLARPRFYGDCRRENGTWFMYNPVEDDWSVPTSGIDFWQPIVAPLAAMPKGETR